MLSKTYENQQQQTYREHENKIFNKYDSREIVSLKQGNIINMYHKSMIRDYRRAGPRISAELFAGCAEWLEGWAELGWAWPTQHQQQKTA